MSMSEGAFTPPPPPPPPPPPAPSPAGSDFLKPFTFVFDDPRWLPKILLGGVFYILGIFLIGFLFIFGYLARLARNVIAGVEHPLPEWDDLGEYLGEGLRLFGVALVWVLPLIALGVLFVVPAAILSESGGEVASNIGGCVLGTTWCLIFPLALVVTFFLPASLLRVVVERRFGAGFEFDEIWAFIKANVGDYLLALVVYFVARFLAGFGILLLCIGVVFTGFWGMAVWAYGFAQVYRRAGARPPVPVAQAAP